MPTLYKGDQQVVTDDLAEIRKLTSEGWSLPPSAGGAVPIKDVSGFQADVPVGQLGHVLDPSAAGVSSGEQVRQGLAAARESTYGGALGKTLAAASGALSVGTLGLSDVAADAVGVPIKEYVGHNPGFRAAGEAAGIGATILTPMGAEGALSKLPTTALSNWAGSAASVGGRVARAAAEAEVYNAQQAISEQALSDPGFSAEGALSRFKNGAFLSAALGAGGAALGEVGGKAYGAYKESRAAARAVNETALVGSKEVTAATAEMHKSLDEAVQHAAANDTHAASAAIGEDLHAVHGTLSSAHTLEPAQVEGIRSAQAAVRDGIDGQTQLGAADVDALFKAHNAAAADAGVARMSAKESRAAANAFAEGDAGPLQTMLDKTDALLAHDTAVDAAAERLFAKAQKTGKVADGRAYLNYAGKLADEHGLADIKLLVSGAVKRAEERGVASVDETAMRTILGHTKAGAPSANTLAAIAEMSPDRKLEAVNQLGKYYRDVQAATAHDPVAAARVQSAFKAQSEAAAKHYGENVLSSVTPELIADTLGFGVEQLTPDVTGTPAEDFVKFLTVRGLTKGMLRGRRSRGIGDRIMRAVGRHAAGSAAAKFAADRLPGAGILRAGLVGGAYSAGTKGFETLAGGGGLRSVMQTTGETEAHIADAVKRLGTGKPAKRRVMPALDHIFDKLVPDEEHKSKTPAQKFTVLQDRLSQYAVSPQSFQHKFYDMLHPVQQVSEHLADAMETTLGAHLQYAADNTPKDPGTMMMLGKSMWKPTDRELYEYGLRMMGVTHPLETIDMVADGLVPPQAIEALRTTNPGMFAKFQQHVMDNVDDIRANSTYDQRVALGLAVGLPVDPTTDPRYVTFMQSMHAQTAMAKAAGNAAESKTPEESMSDAQKMLA